MKVPKGLPVSASWHEAGGPATLASNLAEQVAYRLRAALSEKPRAVLAVSGGATPQRFLAALSVIPLPWQNIDVVLVDERWVPVDHPDSNERMIRKQLLQNAAQRATLHSLIEPFARPEEGLDALRQRLSTLAWPLDVAVLGMGLDGHTASIFPDMPSLETALYDGQLRWVEAYPPAILPPRVTMTANSLKMAKDIFLHIEGEAKRQVLAEACLHRDPLIHPIWSILEHAGTQIFWAPEEA